MPIDRRTFVLGSGAVAAGSALATLATAAALEQQAVPVAAAALPMAPVTTEPSLELGILGWDRSTGHTAWIAIDQHWRGAWH